MTHWRPGLRVCACVVAAALVTGLPVAWVTGRPAPAVAGPAGASPVVYLSLGSGGVSSVPLAAAGSGSTAVSGPDSSVYGPVAVNSSATLAVAARATSSALAAVPAQVEVVTVASDTVTAAIALPSPAPVVSVVADPADPDVAWALQSDGLIDQLALRPPGVTAVARTAGTLPAFASPVLTSMAATPTGSDLLVGFASGGDYGLYDIPAGSTDGSGASVWYGRGGRTNQVTSVAIDPTGSEVYLALDSTATASPAEAVAVPYPLPKPIADSWTASLSPATTARGLTVSRDGARLYLAGAGATASGAEQGTVAQLDAASGAIEGQAALPALGLNANLQGGASSVALSPDGRTLVVLGEDGNSGTDYLVPVAVPGPVPGGPVSVGSGGTPPADGLAVTPDQAPVAALAPASGTAGSPAVLDGSGSSVAFGSIVSYRWAFGDGSTAVTAGPKVSHVYASAGSYTATVTETDRAGNSIPPALYVTGTVNGPGTTPYLQASITAQAAAPVAISAPGTPPPPVPTTVPGTNPHPTSTTQPPAPRPGSPARSRPGAGHPVLDLSPAVGPPGSIVTVTGRGFPAHVAVRVSWSVSTGSVVIMSDGTGNLPAATIDVLVPDVLGPRFAVAAGSGARAPFLVIPDSAEPGGRNAGLLFRSEGP